MLYGELQSADVEDKTLVEAKDINDEQNVWSVARNARVFVKAVQTILQDRKDVIGTMTWTKEDPVAVDFITGASNMRMHNYRIDRSQASRWQVQSKAGSIIPAVATTNAIVASLQVIQLLNMVRHDFKDIAKVCRTSWVRYFNPTRGQIIQESKPDPPNPDCPVCGDAFVNVCVPSFSDMKTIDFAEKVCGPKGVLGSEAPALYMDDTCIHDPTVSEDEAEEEGMHPEWPLSEWDIINGSVIQLRDEAQGFTCNIVMHEVPELDEKEFPLGFAHGTNGQQTVEFKTH